MWVRYRRGEFGTLPSPEEAHSYSWTPPERSIADAGRSRHFIGSPERVASQIRELANATGATEFMVTSMIHNHADRLRSYDLLAHAIGNQLEDQSAPDSAP